MTQVVPLALYHYSVIIEECPTAILFCKISGHEVKFCVRPKPFNFADREWPKWFNHLPDAYDVYAQIRDTTIHTVLPEPVRYAGCVPG